MRAARNLIRLPVHPLPSRAHTATGDKMEWKGFGFEIIDMDGHRIDKLLVSISGKLKEEMENEDL